MPIRDLSGFGDTAQEAIAEFRVAVELAIEEFTDAGTEISKPIQAASHSGQLRLRLPKSVHARLAARAEREGVSLNALIMMSYVALIGRRGCEAPRPSYTASATSRLIKRSIAALRHRAFEPHRDWPKAA